MAKKQTFGDKAKKSSESQKYNHAKVIKVKSANKSEGFKFDNEMIKVPADLNLDQEVNKIFSKK